MYSPKNVISTSLIVRLIAKSLATAFSANMHEDDASSECRVVRGDNVEVKWSSIGGQIKFKSITIQWSGYADEPRKILINKKRFSNLVNNLRSWVVFDHALDKSLRLTVASSYE